MLIPRKVKFRKQHHPKRGGHATGGTTVSFGDYGIQARHQCLRHEPSDRVCSCCDDPSHQAWWEGLDQHLPRPPSDQEACGNSHGFR